MLSMIINCYLTQYIFNLTLNYLSIFGGGSGLHFIITRYQQIIANANCE